MWHRFGGHILLEVFLQERPQISVLLDSFTDGCSRTVAGSGFNPNQGRVLTLLGSLQRGCEFKTVPWHDSVVSVSGCNQGCRITGAFLDVVEW